MVSQLCAGFLTQASLDCYILSSSLQAPSGPPATRCFLFKNETVQAGEGEAWPLPPEQERAGDHSQRVLSVVSITSFTRPHQYNLEPCGGTNKGLFGHFMFFLWNFTNPRAWEK